ncbi:hypothetical protein PG989_006525 [Apiospora arundinis]
MAEFPESDLAACMGQARMLTPRINTLIRSLDYGDGDDDGDVRTDLEYFQTLVAEVEKLRGQVRTCAEASRDKAEKLEDDRAAFATEVQEVRGDLDSQRLQAAAEYQRFLADQERLSGDEDTLATDQATLRQDQNTLRQDQEKLADDKAGLTHDRAQLQQGQKALEVDRAQLRQDRDDLNADRAALQEAQAIAATRQMQLDEAKAANEAEAGFLAKTRTELNDRSVRYHTREQDQATRLQHLQDASTRITDEDRELLEAKIAFEKKRAAHAEDKLSHAQQQKNQKLAFEKVKLAVLQQQQVEKSALSEERLALSEKKASLAERQKSDMLTFMQEKEASAQQLQADKLALSGETIALAHDKAAFFREREQATYAAVEQVQATLQELREVKEQELAALRGDLDDERQNAQLLHTALEVAEAERDARAAQVAEKDVDLEEAATELANLQVRHEELQAVSDGFREDTSTKQACIDQLEQDLADARQCCVEQNDEIVMLRDGAGDTALRDANLRDLAAANDEWARLVDTPQDAKAARDQTIEGLEASVHALRQEKDVQTRQAGQLHEANEELSGAIEALQYSHWEQTHNELQKTHQELQKDHAKLRQAHEELSGAVEAMQRPASPPPNGDAWDGNNVGTEWRSAMTELGRFIDTLQPVVEDGSIEPIMAALGLHTESRKSRQGRAHFYFLSRDAPAGQWCCAECVGRYGVGDEEAAVSQDGTCQFHEAGQRCLQVMWQEGVSSVYCRLRNGEPLDAAPVEV